MAVKQESIILHDFGDLQAKIRRRTTSRGTKDRVSIEISATPLVHTFDDVALGADVAEEIRDQVEKGIKSITAIASPATRRRREYEARVWANGTAPASVRKRYSGGRTGDTPPKGDAAPRLFNHSGRLANGVFVRQNPREKSFTTNVPANRFTDDTQHLVQRLIDLVPALRPDRLAKSPEVQREIKRSINLVVAKAAKISDAKKVQLRQARINAAKALFGLGKSLAGL